jgi:hypothetical protein
LQKGSDYSIAPLQTLQLDQTTQGLAEERKRGGLEGAGMGGGEKGVQDNQRVRGWRGGEKGMCVSNESPRVLVAS